MMLTNYLKSFNLLSDDEIETFVQNTVKRKLNKQDYFIKGGDKCKEVAFIVSGIFRSFYISDKGEEITYCITFQNNLMTAYSSFITEQSTIEYIQAITDVELLVIPKSIIEDLTLKEKNWMTFSKIMAEQQYLELEKRIFQLQNNNAEQRYSDLINNQPEFVQHIPLQYLASYLGITQRHLSRIRNKISF